MHASALTPSLQTQQAAQLTASELSSGKRVTSAAVDPAGLAIANALTAQAAGSDQGASNAQDAVNASRVADGAIASISDSAQHLYTLSATANNDLLSSSDRANLQSEADQTSRQISSVAGSTQFNGLHLLDGATPAAGVQTGADEGTTTALALPPSAAGALGLANVDLSSSASAATSERAADTAIGAIGSSQAALGSQTVALQIAQQNGESASNNLTASASTIADADITKAATKNSTQKTALQVEVALEVQAKLAASSVAGLFIR